MKIIILSLFFLLANNRAFAQAPQKYEKVKMYQIKITIEDKVVTGTLEDNPASRDFIVQLPLNIKLEDYSSTEKITYLPKKLSTKDAPPGIDPEVGDIAYYAPWGNIAIFYKDFGYSQSLLKLGRITGGIEYLHYSGSKNAKIELVP